MPDCHSWRDVDRRCPRLGPHLPSLSILMRSSRPWVHSGDTPGRRTRIHELHGRFLAARGPESRCERCHSPHQFWYHLGGTRVRSGHVGAGCERRACARSSVSCSSPTLCIDRSRASHTSSRDRLAVDWICHIAGSKDALNTGVHLVNSPSDSQLHSSPAYP